jgi:hypothetical protein
MLRDWRFELPLVAVFFCFVSLTPASLAAQDQEMNVADAHFVRAIAAVHLSSAEEQLAITPTVIQGTVRSVGDEFVYVRTAEHNENQIDNAGNQQTASESKTFQVDISEAVFESPTGEITPPPTLEQGQRVVISGTVVPGRPPKSDKQQRQLPSDPIPLLRATVVELLAGTADKANNAISGKKISDRSQSNNP